MINETTPYGRVKRIIREEYDDSDEPKARLSDVQARFNARVRDAYNKLRERGEVYEYGEYVRVTDDVLE